MAIDIEKYIVAQGIVDLTKVLSNWTWLTKAYSAVALTKAGDALLTDEKGYLFLLDVGGGTCEYKADNYQDFFNKKLSYELVEELLLPALIDKLEASGMLLKPVQVFSYKRLPIIGGAYDENNMFALDLYEHYNLTGDLHFQLKELSDGTPVRIKWKKD